MAETGASVPLYAPLLTADGVKTSRAVRGGAVQWASFGAAANLLAGSGRVLVPTALLTCPLSTSLETLRFYVQPSPAPLRRAWLSRYEVKSAGAGDVTFTAPDSSTTVTSYSGTGSFGTLHFDDGSSYGSSAAEITAGYQLSGSATGSIELQSLTVIEVPRPDLALDVTDYGVELAGLSSGQLIYGTTGVGPPGVALSLAAHEARAWRSGLFQFARGTTNRLSTTSGVLADVFLAPPALLGTKRNVASTTRTLTVYARAASGAGTTGEIIFTMTSGATLTLTVTSAMAPSWLSGSLAVDCEDLSVSDGRRSARDDKCSIQWRRTGGANSVFLESISIING